MRPSSGNILLDIKMHRITKMAIRRLHIRFFVLIRRSVLSDFLGNQKSTEREQEHSLNTIPLQANKSTVLRIMTSNKCTSICLLDIQTLLHVSALLGHLQGVIHYRI
jgi:hypothetical protein